MHAQRNSDYLESRVLTAPPHRLHLLLIEGAIRFGRQAEEPLSRGDTVAAAAPLLRAIDIVGELLAGVRENKDRLNEQIAGLYWFIFRRVSEAKVNSDANALAEALRLLEFERQTWQMVCEKFGGAKQANAALPRTAASLNTSNSEQQGRFSLEA